jgi:drug/metabolite transporter (DMT)-like permease
MQAPAYRPAAAYGALIFGVLSLTLSSFFIRWSEAPGPVTSFYRMAIAAVVLLPVMVWHWRRVGIPPMRWLLFPIVGGLFTALDHATWSTAIGWTRMANATLMNNMAPLWVVLFAALVWRERLRGRFWLGLVVTLAGAAVVLGSDVLFAPGMNGGNLLALLSSLFYAGYFLITQRGRTRLDALSYIWLVDVFSAVGLLSFTQVFAMPLIGFSQQTYLIFLASAFISQVGGYFAIAFALGHLRASVVSPTLVAQPVLTALVAIPLAGEVLMPGQWLGGLAVVTGIYLVNISRPVKTR